MISVARGTGFWKSISSIKRDHMEVFTNGCCERAFPVRTRPGGLKRGRDYIRELEESDPNCWKYPRHKKSDDIAAIAISF
jgi:hypothetical protein